MNKEHRNLDILLEIEYLFLVDAMGKCKKHDFIKRGNSWSLEAKSDHCRFTRDIMIQEQYRSYGIGRLAINKMLSIAQEHVPAYSLKGVLANVYPDASKKNYDRRDKLYRNIGFTIEEDSFHIDRIGNLNIKQSIDDIEKIDLAEELYVVLNEKKELENDMFHLEKAREYTLGTNSNLLTRINQLWRYLIFSWVIFIVVLYIK